MLPFLPEPRKNLRNLAFLAARSAELREQSHRFASLLGEMYKVSCFSLGDFPFEHPFICVLHSLFGGECLVGQTKLGDEVN